MTKFVVLDYSTLEVHFFDMEDSVEVNEDLVIRLGFKPSQCSWMAGDVDIFHHKGIVK